MAKISGEVFSPFLNLSTKIVLLKTIKFYIVVFKVAINNQMNHEFLYIN